MLMREWNLEEALASREKDALEIGMERGRNEGRKEGMERGLQKGRNEGRKMDVKNLLDFGMAPEQISTALKLPINTVRQYLDNRR